MSDREYPPERILICSASGDWIPEEDGPGCPHRDCNGEWGDDPCGPILYVRASPDQVTVNRADIATVLGLDISGPPVHRLRAALNQEEQ